MPTTTPHEDTWGMRLQDRWARSFVFRSWLVGFFAAITTGWAAGTTNRVWAYVQEGLCNVLRQEPWPPLSWPPVAVGCIPVLFCAFFAWLLYRMLRQYWTPHTRPWRKELPEPRSHLVLLLSNVNPGTAGPDLGPVEPQLQFDSLDADLRRLRDYKAGEIQAGRRPKFWPWEQCLRALRPHLATGRLERVFCLCSPESLRQFPVFQSLLGKYPELAAVEIRAWFRGPGGVPCASGKAFAGEDSGDQVRGWNYEDFDELVEGFDKLFRHIEAKYDVQDEQIMVDFTSGTKVASVAALAFSIDRSIKNQYVQTNLDRDANDYLVWSYDVIKFETKPALTTNVRVGG